MMVRRRRARVSAAACAALIALPLLAASPPSAAVPVGRAVVVVPRAVPGVPVDLRQEPWKRQGQTYRTVVTWRAPEDPDGAEAVTYAAEVERDGEIILQLEFEAASVVLRRLVKGQTYTVRVYAVNEDGRGPAAQIVLRVPGRIPADDGGFDPGELAGPRPSITGVTPKQGRAGSFVRITGLYFENLRYVRFGNRLAGFFVERTGVLVATVPAGSGTIDIEVATSGGVARAEGAFTYSGGR